MFMHAHACSSTHKLNNTQLSDRYHCPCDLVITTSARYWCNMVETIRAYSRGVQGIVQVVGEVYTICFKKLLFTVLRWRYSANQIGAVSESVDFAGYSLMWIILTLLTVVVISCPFPSVFSFPFLPVDKLPFPSSSRPFFDPPSTSLAVRHLILLQHIDLAHCYPKLRWKSVFEPLAL